MSGERRASRVLPIPPRRMVAPVRGRAPERQHGDRCGAGRGALVVTRRERSQTNATAPRTPCTIPGGPARAAPPARRLLLLPRRLRRRSRLGHGLWRTARATGAPLPACLARPAAGRLRGQGRHRWRRLLRNDLRRTTGATGAPLPSATTALRGNAAQQRLDRGAHLLLHHVANHAQQALLPRHRSLPSPRGRYMKRRSSPTGPSVSRLPDRLAPLLRLAGKLSRRCFRGSSPAGNGECVLDSWAATLTAQGRGLHLEDRGAVLARSCSTTARRRRRALQSPERRAGPGASAPGPAGMHPPCRSPRPCRAAARTGLRTRRRCPRSPRASPSRRSG